MLLEARTAEELPVLLREAEASMRRAEPAAAGPSVRARGGAAHALPEEAIMNVDAGGLRAVAWELPGDLAVVGKARRLAGEMLRLWQLDHLADDATLAIGELLANAVTYGAPPIRLSLWASADRLCVRVTDHGQGRPRRLDLGPEAVHGRGLAIVAGLATGWGVTPHADSQGKTVWACWTLGRPAPARHVPRPPDPRH
ncbi:ATP-binding protein [Sphaerisporangium rufum]|uniref:ATP-binding protein n=1 Tax=Sphaerisporangium rufum TaxID=1381558 RepID=UPI001951FB58|nr:ATP-binding protein [Sphaerisporangium rufum]